MTSLVRWLSVVVAGALLLSAPLVSAFGIDGESEGHGGISRAALTTWERSFFETDANGDHNLVVVRFHADVIDRVVAFNKETDGYTTASSLFSSEFKAAQDDTTRHFDEENFKGGADRLAYLTVAVLDALDQGYRGKDGNGVDQFTSDQCQHAQGLLGQTLHTVQDFYAHSTYAELFQQAQDDLIAYAGTIPVYNQDNFPGGTKGPCPDSSSSFDLQSRYLTTGYFEFSHFCKSYIPGLLTVPVTYDSEYKCRHGFRKLCGGLNHDYSYRPNYWTAHELAVTASTNILDYIALQMKMKGADDAEMQGQLTCLTGLTVATGFVVQYTFDLDQQAAITSYVEGMVQSISDGLDLYITNWAPTTAVGDDGWLQPVRDSQVMPQYFAVTYDYSCVGTVYSTSSAVNVAPMLFPKELYDLYEDDSPYDIETAEDAEDLCQCDGGLESCWLSAVCTDDCEIVDYCQTYSNHALFAMAQAMPDDSVIYSITSSSARDSDMAFDLNDLLRRKNIQVRYISLDSCSPIDGSYQFLSQQTGSQLVFTPLTADDSADNIALQSHKAAQSLHPASVTLTHVINQLAVPWIPMSGASTLRTVLTPPGADQVAASALTVSYTVQVDNSMQSAEFAVTCSFFANATVYYTAPNGDLVPLQSLHGKPSSWLNTTTSTPIPIAVKESRASQGYYGTLQPPLPGSYVITFSGLGEVDVLVTGLSGLQLRNVDIVQYQGRAGHEGWMPASATIAGSNATISATIFSSPLYHGLGNSSANLSTTSTGRLLALLNPSFVLTSLSGQPLSVCNASFDSMNDVGVQGMLPYLLACTVPAEPFRVSLTASLSASPSAGQLFQRVSDTQYTPVLVSIDMVPGQLSSLPLGAVSRLSFSVTNHDVQPATYTLEAFTSAPVSLIYYTQSVTEPSVWVASENLQGIEMTLTPGQSSIFALDVPVFLNGSLFTYVTSNVDLTLLGSGNTRTAFTPMGAINKTSGSVPWYAAVQQMPFLLTVTAALSTSPQSKATAVFHIEGSQCPFGGPLIDGSFSAANSALACNNHWWCDFSSSSAAVLLGNNTVNVSSLCRCASGWSGPLCNISACSGQCGLHGICAQLASSPTLSIPILAKPQLFPDQSTNQPVCGAAYVAGSGCEPLFAGDTCQGFGDGFGRPGCIPASLSSCLCYSGYSGPNCNQTVAVLLTIADATGSATLISSSASGTTVAAASNATFSFYDSLSMSVSGTDGSYFDFGNADTYSWSVKLCLGIVTSGPPSSYGCTALGPSTDISRDYSLSSDALLQLYYTAYSSYDTSARPVVYFTSAVTVAQLNVPKVVAGQWTGQLMSLESSFSWSSPYFFVDFSPVHNASSSFQVSVPAIGLGPATASQSTSSVPTVSLCAGSGATLVSSLVAPGLQVVLVAYNNVSASADPALSSPPTAPNSFTENVASTFISQQAVHMPSSSVTFLWSSIPTYALSSHDASQLWRLAVSAAPVDITSNQFDTYPAIYSRWAYTALFRLSDALPARVFIWPWSSAADMTSTGTTSLVSTALASAGSFRPCDVLTIPFWLEPDWFSQQTDGTQTAGSTYLTFSLVANGSTIVSAIQTYVSISNGLTQLHTVILSFCAHTCLTNSVNYTITVRSSCQSSTSPPFAVSSTFALSASPSTTSTAGTVTIAPMPGVPLANGSTPSSPVFYPCSSVQLSVPAALVGDGGGLSLNSMRLGLTNGSAALSLPLFNDVTYGVTSAYVTGSGSTAVWTWPFLAGGTLYLTSWYGLNASLAVALHLPSLSYCYSSSPYAPSYTTSNTSKLDPAAWLYTTAPFRLSTSYDSGVAFVYKSASGAYSADHAAAPTSYASCTSFATFEWVSWGCSFSTLTLVIAAVSAPSAPLYETNVYSTAATLTLPVMLTTSSPGPYMAALYAYTGALKAPLTTSAPFNITSVSANSLAPRLRVQETSVSNSSTLHCTLFVSQCLDVQSMLGSGFDLVAINPSTGATISVVVSGLQPASPQTYSVDQLTTYVPFTLQLPPLPSTSLGMTFVLQASVGVERAIAGLDPQTEVAVTSNSFVVQSSLTNGTALPLRYLPATLPSSLVLCSPVQSGTFSILVPAFDTYMFTLLSLPSGGMSSATVEQYTQTTTFSYTGLPSTSQSPTFLATSDTTQSMAYTMQVPLTTLLAALPSSVPISTSNFAVVTTAQSSGARIYSNGFTVNEMTDGPVIQVLSPSSTGLASLCSAANKLTVSFRLRPSALTAANWTTPQLMTVDLVDTAMTSVASLGQISSGGASIASDTFDLAAAVGSLSPGRSYAVRVTWGCNPHYYGLSAFMPLTSKLLTLTSPSQHTQLSIGKAVLVVFSTPSGCQVDQYRQTINVAVLDVTLHPVGTTAPTLLTPVGGVLAFDDSTTGHYSVDTSAGPVTFTAGHRFVFSVWIGNTSNLAAVAPAVTMLQDIAGTVPTAIELLTPSSPWCPATGSSTLISWVTQGSIPVLAVRVLLLVYYNNAPNGTLLVAASVPASSGSYAWQVPDVTSLSAPLMSCAQEGVQWVAFIASVTEPGVFDSSLLNNRTVPRIPVVPTPPSQSSSTGGGGGGGVSDGSTISSGAVAGIVVGVVVGLLVIACLVFALMRRHRSSSADRSQYGGSGAGTFNSTSDASKARFAESSEVPPSSLNRIEGVELQEAVVHYPREPPHSPLHVPYTQQRGPALPARPRTVQADEESGNAGIPVSSGAATPSSATSRPPIPARSSLSTTV